MNDAGRDNACRYNGAKAHEFDARGQEKSMDFRRLLAIVREAGYTGHIGIEHEGYKLSEKAGILATKRLLTEAGSGIG